MSRRSGEWHLVGHSADPIEASAWDVSRVASAMRRRADEADEITSILQALSDLDGWRGQTAEAFAEKAGEVLDDLGKVVRRYEAVATALDTWQVNVEDGRDDTWTALKKAETAQQTIDANQPYTGTGDEPPGQGTIDDRRDDAEGNLAAAVTAMADAMEALGAKARDRKNDIEDAADIWDDGLWGDFKGAVRDIADVIYVIVEALKIIALVLGAVILVLVFTIGAPFALIVAAIALSVAILVGTLLLYTADSGHYDGSDVAWALADVALSFFGGKAASAALRGMKNVAPGIAIRLSESTSAAALQRLIGGSRTQFQNALRITDPSNNLARWTARLTAAAASEGRQAGDDLLRLIQTDPTRLPATIAQSLRNGGRELAGLSQQLVALRASTDDIVHLAKLDDIGSDILRAKALVWLDVANLTHDLTTTVAGLTDNQRGG